MDRIAVFWSMMKVAATCLTFKCWGGAVATLISSILGMMMNRKLLMKARAMIELKRFTSSRWKPLKLLVWPKCRGRNSARGSPRRKGALDDAIGVGVAGEELATTTMTALAMELQRLRQEVTVD